MASVASSALRPRAAASPRLRIGVFAQSPRQPRWLVESLARLAASDFAEIVVLAVGDGPAASAPLWNAYGRVDRWLFGGADLLKPLPVDALVSPHKRIELRPQDSRWRMRIRSERLDVAVTLGAVPEEAIHELARYGAWAHAFGEAAGTEPELAAVSEVMDGAPVVSAAIRIRRGASSRVACRSYSRTIPFSLARSHDRIFGKATDFLERSLRRLHDEGEAWLDRQPLLERAPASPTGLAQDLRGIATLGARVAMRTMETCFTVGQWSLAFRFTGDEPWSGSLEGFHRLVPPVDRFWADPFPVTANGRHFIFFEELPFASGKGHISVVEVRRDGTASTPRRVLERDYHLSYPFLVEHEGRLYMVPESGANATVEAYRCEEFPHRWRRSRVLMDQVFLADATFHRAGGSWWMFANSGSAQGGSDDELHLFSARDFLGEWKPHRGNPVKADARCSRPAGRLFVHDGALYRPGQICAPLYGSGVALHRVTRLTGEAFAEEEVRRIEPREGLLGLHTINRAGDLSVLDVFARRRRF